MLKEMITKYNSLKINMISKLGESSEGINDELEFLDDAIISSKINYIKKICKSIDNDLAMSDDKEQVEFLVQKRQEFIYEMALLASNNFKNIDFCISILDKNNKFQKCLQALKYYENGNNQMAKRLFDEFFQSSKYMLQHYLISAVYGELLYEEHNYLNAAIFLRKAVEKRSEEIKLHIMLKEIYHKLNDEILLKHEVEIINLLNEGEKNG
jgi:hypothetical protein